MSKLSHRQIRELPLDQRGKHVHFWSSEGQWKCAIPGEPRFPGDDPNWWKTFGLIGTGRTHDEAFEDWKSWQRCGDLAADLY